MRSAARTVNRIASHRTVPYVPFSVVVVASVLRLRWLLVKRDLRHISPDPNSLSVCLSAKVAHPHLSSSLLAAFAFAFFRRHQPFPRYERVCARKYVYAVVGRRLAKF